jgi:regulatory protein
MSDKEIFKVSLNKSMAQCSRKEHCTEDIRKKLSLWGVETEDIDKIIAILVRENFINDTRYATAFVRDKFKYNKWGKVKIAGHLRGKRLPPEIISIALDAIDNEQYAKFIRGILESHKRFMKAKNPLELKAKLLRFGLSKGFESSILYDILGDLEEIH